MATLLRSGECAACCCKRASAPLLPERRDTGTASTKRCPPTQRVFGFGSPAAVRYLDRFSG
eukprot:13454872-Alexandrium_andersonii.AAC.1